MKRHLARLLSFGVTLVLCGSPAHGSDNSVGVSSPHSTATAELHRWLDAEFARYLDFSPLARTRLGDKSDYDRLDDVSDAMSERRLAWRRDSVARMRERFDRDQLDVEGQRSWDLWLYLLERAEYNHRFRYHSYVFGRRGPHSSLPSSLINNHRVDTEQDLADYVARLRASGPYLRQHLDRARQAASLGIQAPYFDHDQAIRQIERIIDGEPFRDGPATALWRDIETKAGALLQAGRIDAQRHDALLAAARRAIREHMLPAYETIHAWLQEQRDQISERAHGASSLPDGAAFYAWRLAYYTTLPLSAAEIHAQGLREVERIHAGMRVIQQQVGFDGSLQDFFRYARDNPDFYFPNTDAGRDAYLEEARVYLDAMAQRLPDYFGILPRARLEVRRVEPFREQPGGSAHYRRGTPDGSRPGVFYVHLADMRAIARYRLENLAYHEGLPGHHMQISIQQELGALPRFRTYHGYTAYSEGWGLYAERLGKDMGFYRQPMNDFGRLTGELWRALRLVVDTGIHAFDWSEQRAVDYLLENSPRPEATVRAEVRRYFNNPGQATAYKVGMDKILQLRDLARDRLGADFSYAEFHDQVLGSGQMPLRFLEAKLLAWIDVQQADAP